MLLVKLVLVAVALVVGEKVVGVPIGAQSAVNSVVDQICKPEVSDGAVKPE